MRAKHYPGWFYCTSSFFNGRPLDKLNLVRGGHNPADQVLVPASDARQLYAARQAGKRRQETWSLDGVVEPRTVIRITKLRRIVR